MFEGCCVSKPVPRDLLAVAGPVLLARRPSPKTARGCSSLYGDWLRGNWSICRLRFFGRGSQQFASTFPARDVLLTFAVEPRFIAIHCGHMGLLRANFWVLWTAPRQKLVPRALFTDCCSKANVATRSCACLCRSALRRSSVRVVAGIGGRLSISQSRRRGMIRGVSSRLSVLSIRCLKLSRLTSCCSFGEGNCMRAQSPLVAASRDGSSTGDCD